MKAAVYYRPHEPLSVEEVNDASQAMRDGEVARSIVSF